MAPMPASSRPQEVNRRSLMGDMRNGPIGNAIAGSMTVVMSVLTAMMLWMSYAGR